MGRKYYGNKNRQSKQQKTDSDTNGAFSTLSASQRKRFLSSETSDTTEDAELLLDAVLGALTNNETIDRFVTALVGIPEIKAKLLTHLLPTLENQIQLIVQPLNDEINHLNEKLVEAELKTDDLEQYSRRHSLRISGIPESEKENTDHLVCEFLHRELEIDIDPTEIDRSHRLGEKRPSVNRPIAVRFVNYCLKEFIYSNRKYLRPGLYINESLSKARSNLFYKARQMKRQKLINDRWTRDGNVFIKCVNGSVKVCTRESHFPVIHLHLSNLVQRMAIKQQEFRLF